VTFVAAALFAVSACTARQESGQLVDTEPERLINTDLTFPKNRTRWSYLSARLANAPADRFAGFRIVLLNPFGARTKEEGAQVARGAKFAQLIYDAREGQDGVSAGELRRLNLIVKDPERFAETGGWGFASFEGDGRPIPIDPHADCVSCHKSGPISLRWPT
jgi:hypothetical protein